MKTVFVKYVLMLALWSMLPAHAATAPLAATAAPAAAAYQPVDFAQLVASSRTPVPGQKIILRPSPVSFSATLLQMPVPQRSDYLRQVLALMQSTNTPKVEQRVVLGYAPDKGMPVYIEQAAAQRLAREAKAGERRRFYALHVYNYSKGPALVVTSLGPRE